MSHHSIEPDFNAATDDEAAAHARQRHLLIYLGVSASLMAVLVIVLLNI